MSRYDTVLYASPVLRVGAFRLPPGAPDFRDTGPIREPLLVFPRNCVRITQAGRAPVVSTPGVVMLYNADQAYTRAPVSPDGDRCEWFAPAPDVLQGALQAFSPRAAEQPRAPFADSHAPGEGRGYLLQRLVVEHLQREPRPDALFVEETALRVVHGVLARTFGAAARAPARGAGRDAAEAAVAWLGAHWREGPSLADVARAVGASPAHLARGVRAHTGLTLHGHLQRLRLGEALERVCAGDTALPALARALGFCSHSHLTRAFHRAFGATPSEVRRAARSRWVLELRRKVTGR